MPRLRFCFDNFFSVIVQHMTIIQIFSHMHLALSVGSSVGLSDLHTLLFLFFFAVFGLTAAAQMMK